MQIVPESPVEQDERVSLRLTVSNLGQASASDFWVDLYVDPLRTPILNTPWQSLCAVPWPSNSCIGAAWHVTETLQPGTSITLSTDTLISDSAYSHWPGVLTQVGVHTIYMQVDSFGPLPTQGSVFEQNEQNNLIGPINIEVIKNNTSLGLPPVAPAITELRIENEEMKDEK